MHAYNRVRDVRRRECVGSGDFDVHVGAGDSWGRDKCKVRSLRQTLGVQLKGGSLCDVEVVKRLDIAGPRLWVAAVTGQVFPEVTIEVIRTDGDQSRLYEIKLTSARVLSISTTGDSAFVESVTLSPVSATLTVFTQKADGSAGTPITGTFACK